jgi:CBS domain containing-hemolysin-like protein
MGTDPAILVLKILTVAVLVFLNGFFVAAEFALVKIRDTQLEPLIRQGHRRARMARNVVKHLDRYLSAAQLGITLASLVLGWVGEPVFSALLHPLMEWLSIRSEHTRETIAFVFGVSALTFLHVTAGEQAPKWLAIQKPLPTALWVATPLRWFCAVAYPFIWILNHSSMWMLRQIGIEPHGEGESVHSQEELRLLFAASQARAGGTKLGHDIVINALDLPHRIAREVMRPRHEIVCLNTEASMAECLETAERTRFSRFPLCEEGDLDRTLGIIHIKDLYAMRIRARRGADLALAVKKIVCIPEAARLETVLQLLLERKLHLAIVVDEYGGTTGMVTLENILEELVGQIQDEFDQEKPLLIRKGEGEWEVDGALPIHDFAELVGEIIEAGEVTTTSGWVTRQMGGFPRNGDKLSVGSSQLEVLEMDGLRVSRLKLQRTEPSSDASNPS